MHSLGKNEVNCMEPGVFLTSMVFSNVFLKKLFWGGNSCKNLKAILYYKGNNEIKIQYKHILNTAVYPLPMFDRIVVILILCSVLSLNQHIPWCCNCWKNT